LLFETYRFDNLDTDESHYLGGWSYVWASLGGPVYILFKGFPLLAVIMLPISVIVVAGAGAALVVIVGLIDHLMVSVASMVAVPLAALAAQGVIAIQLLRIGFIRRGWRGWREGY